MPETPKSGGRELGEAVLAGTLGAGARLERGRVVGLPSHPVLQV